MKCANCQESLDLGSKFCTSCGTPVAAEPPAAPAAPSPAEPPAPQVTTQIGPITVSAPPPHASSSETPVSQSLPFGQVTVNVTLPPPAPPLPPPAIPAPRPAAAAAPAASAAASAPASAAPAPAPAPAKSGGMGIVFGVLLAVVAGAGGYWYSSSKPAAPAASAAPAAPAAKVAPAAPAAPSAEQLGRRKEVLNQLITAGRDGRWSEIKPVLVAINALARPAVGNQAVSKEAFDKGQALVTQGKVAEAIAQFEAANQADPSNVESRIALARAQVKSGKAEAASAGLIEALLITPDSGPAWLLASEAFADQGKREAAVASLKLAVYFAKDRPKAMSYLQAADTSIDNAKFKAVVKESLRDLASIPAR